MPHVVIEEARDLGAACKGLKASTVRNGSEILRVLDVYLSRAGHTALVDCLAIEAGRSQAFFVQLSQKDRQITVRLLPATDPEKTTGVKRLIALIAMQVHELIGGSRLGKTNLQEFLAPVVGDDPAESAAASARSRGLDPEPPPGADSQSAGPGV